MKKREENKICSALAYKHLVNNKKAIAKAALKNYNPKSFTPYRFGFSRKKERILLPVRIHPRENKLIEWIHARLRRKSFIRSFTYLYHVWFLAGEHHDEWRYKSTQSRINVAVLHATKYVLPLVNMQSNVKHRRVQREKTFGAKLKYLNDS